MVPQKKDANWTTKLRTERWRGEQRCELDIVIVPADDHGVTAGPMRGHDHVNAREPRGAFRRPQLLDLDVAAGRLDVTERPAPRGDEVAHFMAALFNLHIPATADDLVCGGLALVLPHPADVAEQKVAGHG